MDIETAERYGNKRAHQRLGPQHSVSDRANKVCYHWLAGRCTRHPCAFLHSDPAQQPSAAASASGPADGAAKRNIVWRNPNAPGGGPPSKWGRGRGVGAAGRAPGKSSDRICNYFLSGNCTYGDNCRFLHSLFVGDTFSLLTPLQGHQKVVTGIALPSGSDKLYSGSKDESVRVWDCQTGQCVGVISMGGEVGCMISEGPWIFIGVPNAVKAWNTQTGTELSLDGPTGLVYALATGNEMLFAGTQDGRILAWRFSVVGNCFEPAASLTGHRLSVVSLVIGAMRLYSGSMDNTIRLCTITMRLQDQTVCHPGLCLGGLISSKLISEHDMNIYMLDESLTKHRFWDLTSLQCLQTLTDHTSVVMSLLCWDQFLLSSSLDKTIKVWVAKENGDLEVTYTHNEEHGILALSGMPDAHNKPVLLCSCNNNARLYELPSFNERGKIFSKEEIRAIQVGPGGLFFTGDGMGELKVWKWLND